MVFCMSCSSLGGAGLKKSKKREIRKFTNGKSHLIVSLWVVEGGSRYPHPSTLGKAWWLEVPTVLRVAVPTLPALQCLFASTIWAEQHCAHTVPLLGTEGTDTHTHAWMCTRRQGQARTPNSCSIHKHVRYKHRTHTRMHSRPLTAHHLCTASDFSLCCVLCPRFCTHKCFVPFRLSSNSPTILQLFRRNFRATDPRVMSCPP